MSVENLKQRLKSGEKPQAMEVTEVATIAVKAGELLEAVDSNPNHPIAKTYRKAVGNVPPDYKMYVDKVDLEALLKDQAVEREQTLEEGGEGGIVVTRKKLVARKGKAPAPSTKEPEPPPAMLPKPVKPGEKPTK